MAGSTETTKRRLLDAARAEFSSYGIAGARVNRIAERAGVNKERIYGHFDSKEGLFRAVVAEAMSELVREVRPGEGSVGDYVGRVFDYHRNDPTLLRLLMFEGLQDGHLGTADASDTSGRAAWYSLAASSLAENTGCSEEDSGRLLLTLIGLGAWPLVMPQLSRLCLETNGEAADLAALKDFIVLFAERGAGAGAGAGPAPKEA
ncbi:TetR/AcrR family transcriptional regulator [Streptomyces sp. AK08-02]|uniref:TetR/AcrR family transcriptional regulator n=1 Tax=Streptomyces sp. AK08-02 TaxID=3028654 RepID=UPI0029B5A0F3|nr:TetR family transcriptional regulator [Streptomyces sp. AK08-02]MDX3747934.1 TetR family transcriptional regulator [Streptomyces sp. AK08-02]